jgi:hypothetical protein
MASTEQWLKYAKAAELLGVNARTIKRWMQIQKAQKALGAVRHGQQWRIPRPADGWIWEVQTRRRLKEAGIDLKPSWEQTFDKLGKENNRYKLETYRLWLAAYSQASVKSEGVTQEDITGILLLWQTACKILGSPPKGKKTEVDKLKSQFPESLRARNFSEERIHFIMSYWPEQKIFKRVRDAHTLKQLEKIRRRVDTAQAVKTCKNLGQKPTAGNLRPLLHKNFMEHINDTRDELPPNTIKAHTPEDIRRAMEADYWQKQKLVQGEINQFFFSAGNPVETKKADVLPSLPVIDFRQPQDGLALRTFRNRHPLKQSPQKEIIETVFDIQNSIPGVDE